VHTVDFNDFATPVLSQECNVVIDAVFALLAMTWGKRMVSEFVSILLKQRLLLAAG
jgi:hypothetical protein